MQSVAVCRVQNTSCTVKKKKKTAAKTTKQTHCELMLAQPSRSVNWMNFNVIFHSAHTRHSMTHRGIELTLLINIMKFPLFTLRYKYCRTHRDFTLSPHFNHLHPADRLMEPFCRRWFEFVSVNQAVFLAGQTSLSSNHSWPLTTCQPQTVICAHIYLIDFN